MVATGKPELSQFIFVRHLPGIHIAGSEAS
jgi:hypothetical protein